MINSDRLAHNCETDKAPNNTCAIRMVFGKGKRYMTFLAMAGIQFVIQCQTMSDGLLSFFNE